MISRTVAVIHCRRLGAATDVSVTVIALLAPRIAVDVITILFPEAWNFAVEKLDAPHPLRALPKIQVGHEKPRRPAMLRIEGFTVEFGRNHRLAVEQILRRHIRRIATVAMQQHER